MTKKKKVNVGMLLFEILMIVLALIYIYPIIMVIFNSFKTNSDLLSNVLLLPKKWIITNYVYVWNFMQYPRQFLNNVIVTSIGLVGIVVFSCTAAYMISRVKTKLSWALYLFCITPMIIPFQSIMITLLKLARIFHLANSDWGLGIEYWGFGIPIALFLYCGYMSTIPKEMDESAMIDGASSRQTLMYIIFPLLKPITTTVIVLDVMWIWNDFLLPLLMVNSDNSTRTLTLSAFTFVGTYETDWQYSMAALVLAVFPSIVFFIIMQKNIVKGVVAGAVKG